MGSPSTALIPHLQLHSCFCKRFDFIRNHHQPQQLSSSLQFRNHSSSSLRRGRLRFVGSRNTTSFNHVVCFAAVNDDIGEKQQDSATSGSTGSVGSVLEDRPDVLDSSQENFGQDTEGSALYNLLYPSKELLPDDKEMSIFDHLEELRQRIFISVLAVGAAILGCFAFSKELIIVLEAPVKAQGVRFLQLAPGEFFFTTLKPLCSMRSIWGYMPLVFG